MEARPKRQLQSELNSVMPKHVILVFLGVSVICVLLLILMWEPPPSSSNQVNAQRLELFKAVLQIGVVGLTGSVISLFVWEYQRSRQLQEKERDIFRANQKYREQLLLDTLLRTTTAYSQVKRAKRLLRARGQIRKNGELAIVIGIYDELMDSLNDHELALENLRRDVKTSAIAFPEAQKIEGNLELMKDYLKKIIKEYERARPAIVADADGLCGMKLPVLAGFLRSGESEIESSFYEPFDQVQKAIRAALVQPELRALA